MNIKTNNVLGFLLASRIPNLVVIALTQFCTAYFLLTVSLEDLLQPRFLLFIISTGMVGAAGYIINDYFDQKIDMVNKPREVIIGTTFRRRLALVSHAILTIAGIAIGFLVDPFVGAVHIFSSGALFTYSAVLHRWILLGTLTISFLASLTLLLVLVYFKEFNLTVAVYSMFGCVIIFIRESVKDIISAKGESRFGFQSIPIVWGIRGAKLAIFTAGIAGMAFLTFYLLAVPNPLIRYFFLAISGIIFWIAFQLGQADQMDEFRRIKKYIDLVILLGLLSMITAA